MSFYVTTSVLYAAFSILLILLLVRVSGNVWAKILTVWALVGMSCYVAYGFASVLGYPTFQELPEKARLISFVTQKEGDPAIVSIWIQEPGADRPRSYTIMANLKQQKQLEDYRREMMAGREVNIERGEKATGEGQADGEGGPEEGAAPSTGDGTPMFISPSYGFRLTLPPARLPAKVRSDR